MYWKDGMQVIGPAFLVSVCVHPEFVSIHEPVARNCEDMTSSSCNILQVAYLDPGNWATAIESGSRFGYRQLWVLVLANLIAIQLQTLSARLGLASGKHLAQVCRDSYPLIVCRLLWIMTEISIVALDLTMVLGELLHKC
jgi:Mn2+/Fe2+ NRAMP family transporter